MQVFSQKLKTDHASDKSHNPKCSFDKNLGSTVLILFSNFIYMYMIDTAFI